MVRNVIGGCFLAACCAGAGLALVFGLEAWFTPPPIPTPPAVVDPGPVYSSQFPDPTEILARPTIVWVYFDTDFEGSTEYLLGCLKARFEGTAVAVWELPKGARLDNVYGHPTPALKYRPCLYFSEAESYQYVYSGGIARPPLSFAIVWLNRLEPFEDPDDRAEQAGNVGAHEIGHLLGLVHNLTDDFTLMSPGPMGRDTSVPQSWYPGLSTSRQDLEQKEDADGPEPPECAPQAGPHGLHCGPGPETCNIGP